jgi:hypothetical protein
MEFRWVFILFRVELRHFKLYFTATEASGFFPFDKATVDVHSYVVATAI